MDNKSRTRILVIDDEKQIRRLLKVTLSEHDYEVEEAVDGREGINKVLYCKPELIILDLGLPDMDGIEVIKKLREWSNTPIIIISVREQESEKIAALDSGADDYVTKPFGMGELLARIRAAMRHASGAGDEPVINFDELVVDIARRRVTIGEKEIKLTPTEYEILKNLAVYAGKVLTHKQLLRAVWGPAYLNDAQYLRVYIGQLRRKIEVDPSRPRHIITESGVGYRLL
ncbi:response regulator [Pelotomaculum terephthalicicum JT]|uniref:response regulator n=1 Tax=Pelotomaculum TaxID=191373 RepID=UPI0009D3BD25|nr:MULTISPECIES: response regulator [Pelotomaculum]MCG9969553.1 response regulator [Pelotomaculum terephthalicicum JT]OPX86138.1 MAG: KDP operon transcriptional regulatory protein KdpE [Pelotomaculum sp. PtaB.Bin117]OPY59965.1 MAG: KDP operon transcriptional regulatory protein KdpE [Pelotomaculum sp. PtaU1.Bin065]